MTLSLELATTAWPAIPERPRVFVPLGSTEQHGPHLPFSTDTIIAEAVAAQLHDGVLAPAIAIGASGEHQDFAGTISIGTDALRFTLIELVRSLATWAGSVVIINGHGGNLEALGGAVTQLRAEGHKVAWAPCVVAGGDSHAGRTETSLLLHLRPDLVNLDAVAAGALGNIAELLPRLASEGTRAVSPNGILGDASGASAAEGASLFDRMLAGVVRRIDAGRVDERGCLIDPGTAR